ncbi:unnamed protein product [Urochloa decumbens]|uniref:Uncharacterized protein n=1 Tax=Urochloa decumbens TaxID=240449 RepID=A0ABC9AVY3_9POAL
MEAKGLKSFVIVVLVLGLVVLEQTQQVQAKDDIWNWCCRTTTGKKFFNDCVDRGLVTNIGFCASGAGCVLLHDKCGGEWPVTAREALTVDAL